MDILVVPAAGPRLVGPDYKPEATPTGKVDAGPAIVGFRLPFGTATRTAWTPLIRFTRINTGSREFANSLPI